MIARRAALAVGMLCCSNLFMTFAWYWHLRPGGSGPARRLALPLVVLASWAIALLEYSIAVPANRIGASAGLSVAQLKIIQEVVALTVFVPFLLFYIGEKWRWDYLWAFLCMVGAVYFVNRHAL